MSQGTTVINEAANGIGQTIAADGGQVRV